MALKPYEQIAPEALAFPINGKTYKAPPIGVKTGLTLVAAMEGGESELLQEDSRSLWQMVLGATYDDMLADDVPADAVARAGFTILVDLQAGRAAAESFWESGIDPELLAAAKAATSDADSTTSPSTGAAGSSTRRRASTSGTNSRTTSKTAPRSHGRKSSNSGT